MESSRIADCCSPQLNQPCQVACPIHQNARGYLAAIAQGEFEQALRIIMEANPLPSICGTICAHPCEDKCRRGKVDKPLSIRALKRFAVEQGRGAIELARPKARREQKVAIVGSGPAGLVAAHDLALMGYHVTIFEKAESPGGALGLYIPLYRLPRDTIKQDIKNIEALGVEIKTGKELGKDFTIDQLQQQGYKSVLLSLGLPVSRSLPIPGIDHKDVLLALPFLSAVNNGKIRLDPTKVVLVIGSGNVAMDVARSAVRCGAGKVRVVCLEAKDEMPAFPWEIEEALEEGVEMQCCSLGPKQVIVNGNQIAGLNCKKVVSVFDAQKRFNPSYDETVLSDIEGNMIILSIGQAGDTSCLNGSGVKLNQRGQLVYDSNSLATSREGVFACGELISGPGTAVQAMYSGRRAALSIAKFLSGEEFKLEPFEPLPDLASGVIEKVKRLERNSVPILPVEKRINNVQHVEIGYSLEVARKEARRCLNCGVGARRLEEKCIDCLTCVRVCPYEVPVVTPEGAVDIRFDQCQACGICVGECPARAIAFNMPEVEDVLLQVESAMKGVKVAGGGPVICFVCSYGAASWRKLPGFLKGIPPQVGLVSVPCVAKLSVSHFIKPFELGAQAVVVAACEAADCPHEKGILFAQKRVDSAKQLLSQAGLDGRLEWVSFPSGDFSRFHQALSQRQQ